MTSAYQVWTNLSDKLEPEAVALISDSIADAYNRPSATSNNSIISLITLGAAISTAISAKRIADNQKETK